jgi:hypothetical protein
MRVVVDKSNDGFFGQRCLLRGRLRTEHLGYPHLLVTGKTRNR